MPELAKADQGVLTRVRHDRIDLKDSVDDSKANPDTAWRMLVACSGKALLTAVRTSESRLGGSGCQKGALAASD